MVRTAKIANFIATELYSMYGVETVTCTENDLFCVRAYPTEENFEKVREFFDYNMCESAWYVSEDKWSLTYALADMSQILKEVV